MGTLEKFSGRLDKFKVVFEETSRSQRTTDYYRHVGFTDSKFRPVLGTFR